MTEKTVKIAGRKADSLVEFLREHNGACDGQRLGQRFVNIYISQSFPELFYEASDRKALEIIEKWLTDHHYCDKMPPLAKER